MSGKKAWALIEEAEALQEKGAREEATWMSLKGPIMQRTKRAVQLAPKDRTILFMATRFMRLYRDVDKNAARLLTDYQNRIDSLGGPTDDVLALVGGRAAYEKHRSAIQGGSATAGTGCVVAVATAMAVFAALVVAAVGF